MEGLVLAWASKERNRASESGEWLSNPGKITNEVMIIVREAEKTLQFDLLCGGGPVLYSLDFRSSDCDATV